MDFGEIIKALGTSGAPNSAALGSGPRPVPLVRPVDNAAGTLSGTLGALAGIQARAAELAPRTEKTIQSPFARAFLGIPSERPTPQWMKTLANGIGSVPQPSAMSRMASLTSGDLASTSGVGKGYLLGGAQNYAHGRQSLSPFIGQDRAEGLPLIANGLAANLTGPNLIGTRSPLLDSSIGNLARAYNLPQTTANPFDLPMLSGLGKLVEGYVGIARRLEELMAGWRKPIESFFERARRAADLYPRDSEGRPIPPWNLRLYLLAQAAYRRDDYVALARFLDEIGADESPDNVLHVRDLLSPTFDPIRPDRRKDWWLLDPTDARRALRDRLENLNSEGGEGRHSGALSYVEEPGDVDCPNDHYINVVRRAPRAVSAERQFFDQEGAALLLQELAQVLPDRQLEVVAMLLAEEAYEQIAHELGIAVGTVKAHVFKVRNNPEVSEVLHLGSGLRPDGAHFRGRNHRK